MRLVGVDHAWVVPELFRRCETGVARRDEDVAERATAVELEPAGDGDDPLHARRNDVLAPAAPGAQCLDVVEELADGRVVAVADAVDERPHRPAPGRFADGQARERRRQAVPVAL